MAAKYTVATVHELVELAEDSTRAVVTPGIFVSRVVKVPRVATRPVASNSNTAQEILT